MTHSPHPNSITDSIVYEENIDEDSVFPEVIRSDRLTLKRVHPELIDLQKFHQLFKNIPDADEVFQWCGWSEHQTLHESLNYIESRVREWDAGSKAEYVLVRNSDDAYLGTGYMNFSQDILSCEFGLWLQKQYWGKRYSGERADLFFDIAFNNLDLNYIFVGCLEQNTRSRKAIESYMGRYGGSYYGTKPVTANRYSDTKDRVWMHHEYAITNPMYYADQSELGCMVPGMSITDITFS